MPINDTISCVGYTKPEIKIGRDYEGGAKMGQKMLYASMALYGTCESGGGAIPGSEKAMRGINADPPGAKDATEITKEANLAFGKRLNYMDTWEVQCALNQLYAPSDGTPIYDGDRNIVWNISDYNFVKNGYKEGPSVVPPSCNPSLWRNSGLNAQAGIYMVCDGIYQVRAYDMANVTFIRTDKGWIVFDVMMCMENMLAARAMMEKEFGELKIRAVLYSHPHIDHYGGIGGLISKADVADASLPLEEQLAGDKVAILAPQGFLKHAVEENIYAGSAMGRRAMYQYGTLIKPGIKGRLAMGIGLGQSVGTTGLIAPTYEICSNETITIDNLTIEFQLTPGTEAPVEVNAYIQEYNALWLAENCTGTMHNIYTLRGAQVRDAGEWARYILEAKQLFGDRTEVVFQSHNWPHWEKEKIKKYMEDTAAVYQFINDQTLHYIDLGYTSAEISNMLRLPDKLDVIWYTRQYYGTLSHNIKAVYQKNMGWYDANPVNLNPLSPADHAKKLVEYLGDPEAILRKAKADFEQGNYQWVAEITKELVYADPGNQEARNLCADALEQLGYQSESGTWRNCYLTGALELRNGNQADSAKTSTSTNETKAEMTAEMILKYIDICTDALAAQEDDFTANIVFSDTKEQFYVKRYAGVLLCYPGCKEEGADGTITCTKLALLDRVVGKNPNAAVQTDGDATIPDRMAGYITEFTRNFNIIEP